MKPTVAIVIARFLEHRALECQAGLIGRRSHARSADYLGRFAKHFGHQTIDQCRKQDLTRFILLHPSWQSPHTKLGAVAQVVLCFRWAADPDEGGLIDRCPYRRPRGMEQPEPRAALTKADYRAVMLAARRKPSRRPAGGRTVTPSEQAAWRAKIWALASNPALADDVKGERRRGRPSGSEGQRVFDWLKERPEWRDQLPPSLVTFRRALAHVGQFMRETGQLPPRHEFRRVRGFGYRASRRSFRAGMIFLWRTGCRTCEMRAARIEDIDWQARVVRLRKHKTSKSTGAVRVIPLDRHVLRMLRVYLCGRTSGPIFLNGRGRRWTPQTFSDLFRRYADLAGVAPGVSPYGARHAFISHALENDVGERQVADVTGHKTTRYIEWYSRSIRSKTDYLHNVLAQCHRKGGQS